MKKYLITYHAPVEAMSQMENISSDDAQKGMEMWMQWAQKCGDHLVDLGSPLGEGQSLNVKGEVSNSGRQVCGYSILQADDMDHAKKLLEGHPHLSGWNDACEIELHEVMPLM